jgi:signal transduction histidine kinase/class 3 adenylate cyclase
MGFCRVFLRLKEHSKVLDRISATVFYMSLVLMVLTIISRNPLFIKLINIPVGIAPIFSIITSIILFKKLREAKIFLCIVSIGMCAIISRHFNFIGVINYDHWGYVYYSAHIIQALLFTFGLSDRIFKLQKDKQKAEVEQVKQSAINVSLREMDKHKTMFFQRISHELRTPLTLILNPLESELEDKSDNRNLSVAFKNAKRLYRLVTQVLDYEKSKESTYLEMRNIDLVGFLEKASEFVRPTCEKKGIMFALELNGYRDIQVLGTLDHLEKIIFNYLSNALKYTPKGGRLKVSLDEYEGDVRVTVVDSGVGIPKDQHDKLFKEFSRVEGGDVEAEDGTGLGLALVKQLAEELGGKVGVESDEGVGARFWVSLKRSDDRKKVYDFVYVDDELNIRDLIEMTMEELADEYSFIVVESGKEVRKILEESVVKTVVSDALMPNENGIELLTFISESYPETFRVLMSGNTQVANMKDIIDKKIVQKVVTKPVNIRGLVKYCTDHHLSSDIGIDDTNNDYNLADYEPRSWHISDTDGEDLTSEIENDAADLKGTEGELILVVDDMHDMRNLISKTLRTKGCRVVTAKNGVEALEVMKTCEPGLLIVDWMMPVMDGPTLVKRIREDESIRSTPVIMLTAKSDRESQIAGTQSGVNAYLGKPFNEIELTSLVNNLLKLKESETKVIELNNHLQNNVLKRFLPEKLVNEVVQGNMLVDEQPNVVPITVMFADICNFTGKSFELGPKTMLKILNQYMKVMNKIIFEHGGTIDKFVGDSIMVLFGAPEKMGAVEQVDVALTCVDKMGEALEELNEAWVKEGYPTFEIRVGVHHGPAVVGYVGSEERIDYTALGGTVNMASRIEGVAEPGTLYFSETVRDLSGEREWTSAGSFDLKNVAGKVMLYKLPLFSKQKAA